MKKLLSRFFKSERGVVMMEYVVLGVFTVAVTVVAAMTLGIAYTGDLNTMSLATVGDTTSAVKYQTDIDAVVVADIKAAESYLQDLDNQASASTILTNTAPTLYK